jgi:hypothetical protein
MSAIFGPENSVLDELEGPGLAFQVIDDQSLEGFADSADIGG